MDVLCCLGLVCYEVYGHKPVRAEHSKIFFWLNICALLQVFIVIAR